MTMPKTIRQLRTIWPTYWFSWGFRDSQYGNGVHKQDRLRQIYFGHKGDKAGQREVSVDNVGYSNLTVAKQEIIAAVHAVVGALYLTERIPR